MVFLDLRDAYLQVLFHPDNRKYFRFVASGRVYQFKALCFVLSTMPQFFTRVMAPVSAMLHRADICICRFLDDWLIQAASRVQVLQARDAVLQLCQSLGIVFNLEKSHLEPVQSVVYLGVLLDSVSFRASPAQKRVEKLLTIGDEFLLRGAASIFLARALRSSGFSHSISSWRSPQDAITSTPSSSLLGSQR